MAIAIRSPQFSFIQFNEDAPVTCGDTGHSYCLPVFAADDIAFQFIVRGETVAEIDELCDFGNELVIVGLVDDCDYDWFQLNFRELLGLVPEKIRIGELEVLYNWPHGLPGFDSLYAIGECFKIKVQINHPTQGAVIACSNCMERIAADCYTSVLEYGAEENQFGFNYCGGGELFPEEPVEECAEPMIIQFTDAEVIKEPYTAYMKAKYGDVPNVEIWILEGGQYVQPMIRAGFDAYPPTMIIADLGGAATGFLKIS